MAGMDANAAGNPPLDSFYGAINTNGDGNLIWHERFDDIVDNIGYDDTFNSTVTIGSNGYYLDTVYGYNYLVGANGNAVMLIGSGSQFSLNIGIHAPTITPTSSVWIYPVNITNAANYTPITNAFAPGELVDLYGNFGVATNVDSALPIPTELSGVQVFVNGTAAPVYLVSANQISALVPYEVSGNYFATFQVEVNGSKSNSVTVYVDNSSPGIYTLAQNGQGSSAILHADYSEVTDSSPAVPGETVLLFMNGLGNVTPTVADGAVGPSSPLSYSDEELTTGCPSLTLTPAIPCIIVTLYDSAGDAAAGTVQFAGLAPCCVGLYQVNFTLPSSGLVSGDAYIGFETLEGLTDLSTIALSSGFTGTAVPAATRSNPKLRHHPASYRKRTTNHRRALPDRVLER
jgi:uncharacterized protein (TIGR03437 family)